ncbi:tail fiber domain-containing protein [Dyadobacter bucti]|uniref:tail fiber domain-containing protein n=1 Tax=Dyadobacter bucti TaxID=2572203 RepID=UPI0011092DD5|nr:tail fiber domain-containing protein [Dyadobacter bucti]
MKIILSICLACLLVVQANAQVPEKFSFQGVAKNAAGQPVPAGTNIKVRFTVRVDNSYGQSVYQETHFETLAGSNGIFNIAIGEGQEAVGNFSTIDWPSHPYFLQVEIDIAGGDNYVDVGTSQMLSTPYALHSKTSDGWTHNIPIVQKGIADAQSSIPTVGSGPRFVWYPGKSAFRAGSSNGTTWEGAEIGVGSFAAGSGTTAKGNFSAAFGGSSKAMGDHSVSFGSGNEAIGKGSLATGTGTKAIGDYSVAVGDKTQSMGLNSFAAGLSTIAFGNSSVAFGQSTHADGEASFALGVGVVAKAYNGIAFGTYNNIQDNAVGTKAGATPVDRIFQIGNGTSEVALSNVVTVLRNGNVGIGNNSINPTHILDVGGRMKVRAGGGTPGIYMGDAGDAFVGLNSQGFLGFYVVGNWILTCAGNAVIVAGDLGVSGNVNEGSDRRWKKDITSLSGSLDKILGIKGYNYHWIDEKKGKDLQTGVIAQEIEPIFPELVSTDEKGFKSVTYRGFIPHLIESVKELKKENDQLKADYAELKGQTGKRLEALEARLDQLSSGRTEPNSK